MAATDSILCKPAALATLVNETAVDDFLRFTRTLELWSDTLPPLYVYTTASLAPHIPHMYNGKVFVKTALDAYSKLDRLQMESLPSRRGLSNLFHDFTQEKPALMEWAINSLEDQEKRRGVLFCDADIFWLGQLPLIQPGKPLGLSPHGIRPHDEMQYGVYNAGFLWMNDTAVAQRWAVLCNTSFFFEQGCLQTLEQEVPAFKFGFEYNYGWWRMFQSPTGTAARQEKWSLKRDPTEQHAGILVDGKPLSCIHTHWRTNDRTTNEFNEFVRKKLSLLKSQPKVQKLIVRYLK